MEESLSAIKQQNGCRGLLTKLLRVLVIVVFLEGVCFLYIFIKQKCFQRYSSSPLVPKASVNPTGVSSSSPYKILKGNSVDGRDVIYQSDEKEYAFSGIGVKYVNIKGKKEIVRVMGVVDSWQDIFQSQDKYLLIRDSTTGEILPPIRVVYGLHTDDTGERFDTAVAVEVLDSELGSNPYHMSNLAFVEEWGWNKLNSIVKSGDFVAILPKMNFELGLPLRDKDNNLIAAKIIYRRKYGFE